MASQAYDEVQKHHHVSYLRVNLAIATYSLRTHLGVWFHSPFHWDKLGTVHFRHPEQQPWGIS